MTRTKTLTEILVEVIERHEHDTHDENKDDANARCHINAVIRII